MLRQQEPKPDTKPNRSLADFVAPVGQGADHVGAFAVTVHGAEAQAKQFEAAHDDYNAIMVKLIADRLAEAGAEYLHAQARRDWGYGAERAAFGPEDLVAEKYRGIRPAFGYPGVPRPHREAHAVPPPRRGGHRGLADRELRDVAGGQRLGALLRASAGRVLHDWPPRRGPGRGLRPAQGHDARGGREVARPNLAYAAVGVGAC